MSQADKETIAHMARDWNRDHDELQARIAELEAEVVLLVLVRDQLLTKIERLSSRPDLTPEQVAYAARLFEARMADPILKRFASEDEEPILAHLRAAAEQEGR